MRRDPEFDFARWLLADWYRQFKRYEDARIHYETIWRRIGPDSRLVDPIVEVNFFTGNYDRVVEMISAVPPGTVLSSDTRLYAGAALSRLGRYADALAQLRADRASGATGVILHEHLAYCLFGTEAFVDAANEYETVLGFDTRRSDVRNHAAESRVRAENALLEMGDTAAAAEQWRLGLALGPDAEIVQRLTRALHQLPAGTGIPRLH